MARSVRITQDELIALNDEMSSLARAGLPLGQGLRALSGDLPGRLGRVAETLSRRLEQGQSLEFALEESTDAFPPVYCAVVAAGLRSGRLAAALEGIATTVRRVADVRRVIVAAMIYPLLLLMIASGLFVFTVEKTAPIVMDTYSGLDVARPDWHARALGIATQLVQWLPWFWVVLLGLLGLWLARSAMAISFPSGVGGRLPTVARILHAGRMATFAEILALMIEQEVPMDEAIALSASASGDRRLQRAGKATAERIRRGETAGRLPEGLPPLLAWLLLTGVGQEHLVRSLRQTGAAYRRKALHWGNWLGVYLPIFLSAGIGGVVALAYVLLVLAPFYTLLFRLSWP